MALVLTRVLVLMLAVAMPAAAATLDRSREPGDPGRDAAWRARLARAEAVQARETVQRSLQRPDGGPA